MIDEKKASMYLVAIVGVVAAVGILVLLMGAGISENVTGQAYIKSKAKDLDGKTFNTGGEIKTASSAVLEGSCNTCDDVSCCSRCCLHNTCVDC